LRIAVRTRVNRFSILDSLYSILSVVARDWKKEAGMGRTAGTLGVLLVTVLMTGCVERRFVITSDPPLALVVLNGQPLDGPTPADDHFVYYGNYHFTLYKDGYAPLEVDQPIPAPWYEWFPLDFFAENLWPWRIRDVRHFHYQLQPLLVPRSDEILNRAAELRDRGKIVAPPLENLPSGEAPLGPGPDATPAPLAPLPSAVPQPPGPEFSNQ
jgi:hypothetical protein